MDAPFEQVLCLTTPFEQVLHLTTSARGRKRRKMAALFLLTFYSAEEVSLYPLREFSEAERACFVGVLQEYVSDPVRWTRQHARSLRQLQKGVYAD